jgi:hypothetical protein
MFVISAGYHSHKSRPRYSPRTISGTVSVTGRFNPSATVQLEGGSKLKKKYMQYSNREQKTLPSG